MIGNPRCHRRSAGCPLALPLGPLLAQALMEVAEVIERAHQIHSRLKRRGLSIQAATPTYQPVKTGSEGRVQTLNIRTVQFLLRQRQRLALLLGSRNQTRLHFDEPLGAMTLDDLPDDDLRPGQQSGTTALARGDRRTKGALPRFDIARQPVGCQQNGTQGGTGFDLLSQQIDETRVAMHREHPAQPEARFDLHRHGHPDDELLGKLDADLIGLNLHQISGLLYEGLMHLLTMPARLVLPGEDGALRKAQRGHDGLRRTALGQECDHDEEERVRLLQIKERRSLGMCEGMAASLTDLAAFLLALDADVARSDDAS